MAVNIIKVCTILSFLGLALCKDANNMLEMEMMEDMLEGRSGDRVERDGIGHHGGHHGLHHGGPIIHHAPLAHPIAHHAPVVHHTPASYHPTPAPYHPPVVHSPAPYKAPVHHAPPAYKEEVRPYQYQYGVHDTYSGSQFQENQEQTADGVVVGSYSVALPDGRTQTVTYHADHYGGFVAEVSYEGTAVYPEPHHAPYAAPPVHHAPKHYAPTPAPYAPTPAPYAPRPYHPSPPVYSPGPHHAASSDSAVVVPVKEEPVVYKEAPLPTYDHSVKRV